MATAPSIRKTGPVERRDAVLRTHAIEALRDAKHTLLVTEINEELRNLNLLLRR
jgi:hypothetical protein